MKKRFTLLITVTALLSMSAIGWAQSYITSSTVNNEFGAGESATIENNSSNLIVRPYSPNSQQNTLITNPTAIRLGSSTASGQNVVINSYNANGEIRGWYYHSGIKTFQYQFVYKRSVSRSRSVSWPGGGGCNTGNFGSWTKTGLGNWTLDSEGWITSPPYADATVPNAANTIPPPCTSGNNCTYNVNTSATIWGGANAGTEYPGAEPPGNQISHGQSYDGTNTPYTANNASPDDGAPLVQVNGNKVNSNSTYNTSTSNGPKTVGPPAPTLTDYIRPTTVAIKGTNPVSMTEFLFKDVSWWYRTFTANQSGPLYHYHFDASWTVTSNGAANRHPLATDGVFGSVTGDSYGTCDATQTGTERVTVIYTTTGYRHEDHTVSWTQSIALPSNRFVNAAIQILGGADVCLTGNIKDETTGEQSTNTANTVGTDAYLIYPTTGYNSRLRVGGTIHPVNMKHDVTDTHKYYNATTPTATAFPTSADPNIFLYPGSTSFDWRGYAANGTTPLTIYNSSNYIDITFPSTTTNSGILGVFGNYSGSNADLYTNTTTGESGDNKGVIEVGPNTTGQQKFHVSSGGIIKNFSSACSPKCEPVNFITNGNVPSFTIKGAEPLSILNTGACNTASIILANAGVTNVQGAVNNAGTAGDLLVQAHGGYVDIQNNIGFTAGNNNNVAVLSDLSYIKTKDFGYSAAGGAGKGHVTVWAKGASSVNGGYISIAGNLTTSSTSSASSWQQLYTPLDKNAGNLAKLQSCISGDIMSAATTSALETRMQTRIQSDDDYITVTGGFSHTGKDGGLFVQGNKRVRIDGSTTIDFVTNSGIGDAVIQSKSADVIFGSAFTYKGFQTSDLFIDGETGVTFNAGSSIEYANTSASAHIGIQANAGTIAFSGQPFAFNNTSTGNTHIWAGTNVTNASGAPLTFTYKSRNAAGQHIDMYAGQNITMNDKLTFTHDDAAGHRGDIALRAFTNAATLFGMASTPAAGCPVRCSDGSLTPTRGNINLNDVVKIDYDGSGNVWMAANADVNINKDYFHTAGKTGPQTGNTKIVAGNSITTGTSATNGGFHYTNNGTGGNFDMKAGTDIITLNNHYITYPAAGSPTNNVSTILKACNNIDIRNSYYYTDVNNTNMDVYWFANNDILSNSCPDSIVYNLSHTTPASLNGDIQWYAGNNIDLNTYVNYNINGKATTKWTALQNITTSNKNTFNLLKSDSMIWKAVNGSITFDAICHGCGTDSMTVAVADNTGDLEWLAGQNIVAAGVTVFYDKKNSPTTHTLWKAGNDIKTDHTVVFNNVNSDYTKWQAGHNIEVSNAACAPSYVEFNNDVNAYYIHWLANNNIKVDGQSGTQIPVDFINYSTKTPCDTNFIKWHAVVDHIDINYADINFRTNDIGEAYWWAGKNIDIDKSNIYFADSGKVNGSGYTEWKAGVDILMDDSKVDFYHDGWGNNGNPLFTGAPSGNQKWYAGQNIIATRTPIDFLNFDTLGNAVSNQNGYIWWNAKAGDIVTQHYSPTNITTVNFELGGPTSNLNDSIRFEAGRDIRTGVGSKWDILHRSNSDMSWIAHNRNIWLQSEMNIWNDGLDNKTLNWAGQHILVDSLYTYRATDSVRSIVWHAHAGNIETNTESSDYVPPFDAIRSNTHCGPTPSSRAMVNITLDKAGRTEWWAGNSIITNDSVKFHYGNTGNATHGMLFHAEEGNIDLRRIFNIADDSKDLIRFEALTNNNPRYNRHDSLASVYPGVCFNGVQDIGITGQGNFRSTDSLVIDRTNRSTFAGNGAKTEVEAYNDIMTAMFNFTSDYTSSSDGDNTDIISRMGDIWLGYSWNDPNGCSSGSAKRQSPVSFDLNRFVYRVPAQKGQLNIKAGYDDDVDNGSKYDGGNIYFTHIVDSLGKGGTYNTEISIPFSNMFRCASDLGGCDYERAGIIGGVARCQLNKNDWSAPHLCSDTGLIHLGNHGNLLVDAGLRGNIIINNGTYLNFQDDNGNTEFRTRYGDIDMRYPFDVDSVRGSLLFLANSDLLGKLNVIGCNCEEKRNNVYLQDFQYNSILNSGSVFVGADNNIKLQYGGLKTINSDRDPFISGDTGYPCDSTYHCDSDTAINNARDLILNFSKDAGNVDIVSGGFAAVASDMIDVYKNMVYNGGKGSGMSTVPKYTTLHGESVAGYGLYIKTQANKTNWGRNALDDAMTACAPTKCDEPCNFPKSILQNVARVTFHSDARIYAENQRVYIGSPVLETFGNLDLNTHDKAGGKTGIRIQTDSLIVHDSLIVDGKLTSFTTWSGLYRDMPIIKLGHHRFTPPTAEDGCKPCFIHDKGVGTNAKRSALDTLYVTFRNGATIPRLHTLVADHTVLSFLTDSFDHVKGDPTINAKFYTDTFKVRNHVELYKDAKHERDGHFELISEEQMSSKDYAGIYARHLHMEPIAPECRGEFDYSQLWIQDPALDVITTSTFGGYGWIHADVHVEIGATLAPGFASLKEKGNYCYELAAGTLKMQDLRLDKGAQIRYSIGDIAGKDGEKADCIEVDELTLHGSVDVIIEQRCGQQFEEGCYPIIKYNSIAVDTVNLHNLKLGTQKIDGYSLTLDLRVPGVVYLCVGGASLPQILREVFIPKTEGVTTTPDYGKHYVVSQQDFKFKAKYSTEKPLKVMTDRLVDGKEEELVCKLNANGEYEYVIRKVTQNIVLTIGPDFASVDNAIIDGRAVWSHNNTIYIRVEKEDIASIYSIAGQLVKRIELPEGDTPVPMERGVYIVTLIDGSVHKVILK